MEGEGSMSKLPLIGITMGDPSGSGPEITVKVLAEKTVYQRCRPLVVGDGRIIQKAAMITGHPEIIINRINNPEEGIYNYGTIDVLHLDLIENIDTFQYGKVSAQAGRAAFISVRKVIELAMEGKVDATVTNALNKEAMNLALSCDGLYFAGHTEIYAKYTNTEKYTMMLAYHDFRVVHVSTHVSLRKACDLVKKDRVLEVIELAYKACRDLGIEDPKVGVCGLNPHAGENGLFGNEETQEIIPAIIQAKEKGINAIGPLAADSAFSQMRGGWYDIVVCMYHDQGHIPVKTLGFVYDKEKKKWKAIEGINVTLGLPIIRTSVDHGTDFTSAGKGTGNELSLLSAVDYAVRMAEVKKKQQK
jgi:4-hydroxythreonine-4-phosphate dehydrogenase